ncbi:TIGR04211 family SH3 domain-containing protein [Cobetia amphilecti]|uniref:TIGR04211 family SH3 domain-containing protein n=1 Tax=Cobetia TaxID=204286 RepID=UPI000A01A999|nr:TIGR04211 family SH3 domain-containing protein [Cobetia amphilecti]WOI26678.1 TIGR04211 family SH3 domain-containing protein [Cobetia amphilecti]
MTRFSITSTPSSFGLLSPRSPCSTLARSLRRVVLGAGVAGSLLLGAPLANAATDRWVADDLTTFVRSGPTDGYRIVGTVEAGQPVELLEVQNDYSKIRTASGDVVWIPSADLQDTQSVNARVPELSARVKELTAKLDGINEEWETRVEDMKTGLETRQARIEELEQSSNSQSAELAQARSKMQDMETKLDTKKQDLLMRYFMYGGGVAGVGLLVGLIVPHLPRRKKKRHGFL